MCATCGCDADARATLTNLDTGATTPIGHEHTHARVHVQAGGSHHHHAHSHDPHDHAHEHAHGHTHEHDHAHSYDHVHADGTRHSHAHGLDHHHHGGAGTVVDLEARVLAKNDRIAALNRAWFAGREILALNMVSSPGAGKTTLLERTIRDLAGDLKLYVVEGDQATANDGERIRAAGAPAVQVNTGTGCHLEADMVERGVSELKPAVGSVLFIENVGNLVCPALFDLGERAKVVIFSVTEGEDKPLKYPHIFSAADVMVLSKIDLLPHVEFDTATAIANARKVKPGIAVLQVSARTGAGLEEWYAWLKREAAAARGLDARS
jgi:hydrogenase nickel incorporation protein HypB